MIMKDVMTKSIECIEADDSLRNAAYQMAKENIGCLPVCFKDRVIGLITDRDIVIRGLAEGYEIEKLLVRDVMTAEPIFCYVDEEIDAAVKKMEVYQIRRIVVLDRSKKLVGIFSLGDLSDFEQERSGHVLMTITINKVNKEEAK